MVKLIFIGQFVVMALAVFGIGLHYTYLRAMRRRHPAIWQSLRRPTLLSTGGTLMMSLPVLRFLWRKEYQATTDQEFSRLSDVVRAYNLVFSCLITALAILIFIRL
jgi:hypothetical protein